MHMFPEPERGPFVTRPLNTADTNVQSSNPNPTFTFPAFPAVPTASTAPLTPTTRPLDMVTPLTTTKLPTVIPVEKQRVRPDERQSGAPRRHIVFPGVL